MAKENSTPLMSHQKIYRLGRQVDGSCQILFGTGGYCTSVILKELLHPLVKELGQIDCFLHDSLHTYEHMLWEFKTVGPHLRPGGLFLAHDVGRHEAFRDFMSEMRIPSSGYRVFHVLGGFRKPLYRLN